MNEQIKIKYLDKERNKEVGLVFYSYDTFGRWFSDNYDYIEVIDIIQSHD